MTFLDSVRAAYDTVAPDYALRFSDELSDKPLDLSPSMIAMARVSYPSLNFSVGSMLSLDLPDASLGGILAFYSIIHVPTEQLPSVFAEFHRVLHPNGQLLLAFQTGDSVLHRTEAFGHEISLEYYWRQPSLIASLLADAGFSVHAQLVREPYGDAEKFTRAYLMATA